MNKTIELQGIVRNLPDTVVPDGAMHELINLRPRDGAWRPVGVKQQAYGQMLTDVMFIHEVSDSITVTLGRSPGGMLQYSFHVAGSSPSAPVVTTLPCNAGTRFAQFHNTLMVSDSQNEVLSILIFDENLLNYSVFEGTGGKTLIPEMPQVTFGRVNDSYTVTTDEYIDDPTPGAMTVNDRFMYDALMGQYLKTRAEQAKKGYLAGYFLIRCAVELADGTMVMQSIPEKIMASDLQTHFIGDWTSLHIVNIFNGFNIKFKINASSEWIADVKAKYANIIKGLNIYVSLPAAPVEITTSEFVNPTIVEGNSIPVNMAGIEYGDPDIKTGIYFLLKEHPLADWVNTDVTIDLDKIEDLDTRTQMPINNLSHHALFGERLFAYNDRIFMGDIKNYLYQSTFMEGMVTANPGYVVGAPYYVALEFDILVSARKKLTVFTGWHEFNYYSPSGAVDFLLRYSNNEGETGYLSFWGYPDSRAQTARLLLSEDGGVTAKLKGTYSLTSLPDQNLSYSKGFRVFTNISSLADYELADHNNSYYDTNRIQACELGNPFYFPPINSYRATGTVLAFCTNAIALSQGQYGQHPLFVFTSEGIWAMRIGTGGTLIESIDPLSREVTNNPDSIIGIDGGTIFATSKGLFVIPGGKPVELSTPAEGNFRSLAAGLGVYEKLISDPNKYQVSDYICTVPFITYIQGAVIGWDYKMKEIIVSNSTYDYSWVYSVENKAWFKISQSFDRFVTMYPVTYGYKDTSNGLLRSNLSEETLTDLIHVHMESRPLKLSESQYKKIIRSLLNGFINSNEAFPFSINILGSTDKVNWYLLNSSTHFQAQESMLTGRSSFSCAYYIVVFGGKVDQEAYFRSLVVEWEDRYNNKIRQ